VPSYNGESKLPNLIASLEQQQEGIEVIVVLDGSTDTSASFLAEQKGHVPFSQLRIIIQDNKGRAAARNTGAQAANGELLLFLDDDMLLTPGLVKAHVAHHLEFPDTILVGNQLENPDSSASDFQHYKAGLSRKWMSNLAPRKGVINLAFITAAHFSIRKSLFMQVGMFDERLRDNEDFDFAVRAKSKKTPIYFDPLMVAWHMELYSCKSFILRQRQYSQASQKLFELKKSEAYLPSVESVSIWKKAIFAIFANKALVELIDSNRMGFIPKCLRFRFYDLVVTSLGSIYIKVPLN
jgi:GT2 family glycosyltransferase